MTDDEIQSAVTLWEYHTAMSINLQAMQVVMDSMLAAMAMGDRSSMQQVGVFLKHFASDKAQEMPEESRATFHELIGTTQRKLEVLAK
jgi:hypothetical protein